MDFATSLQNLLSAHEKECERRRIAETELKDIRLKVERLQEQVETRPLLAPPGKDAEVEAEAVLGPKVVLEPEGKQLKVTTDQATEVDIDDHNMAEDNGAEDLPSESPANSEVDAPKPTKHIKSKSTGDIMHWHLPDVCEFAMMKGWKHIELLKKRNSSGSATSEEVMHLMVSGHYSNKFKSASQLKALGIVETHTFESISATAIIGNSIMIGIIGNYSAQNNVLSVDVPVAYTTIERTFTGLFTVELLLRMYAYRCEFLFGTHRAWNFFDLIVVGSDLAQTIMEAFYTGKGVDLSVLRMLRITRVTRAVRVIKVIRFFKELRMMVFSIVRCGTSLLWSLIIFIVITYIFGIYLMGQVTDYLIEEGKDHPKVNQLKRYFSSVPETIYTLFACMSGGVSWKDLGDDLSDIHWSNTCALSFYVFFTLFVVANILTGIFVDTAIQSAASDREDIIEEQMSNQESELMTLKEAFEAADADMSGYITLQEFQNHLKDQKVRAHFSAIGIEVHQALGLFKLLDQDHSGHLGVEEFVMGCMRLKGGARGIDLASLMYENKKLVGRIKRLESYCQDQFQTLKDVTQVVALGLKYGHGVAGVLEIPQAVVDEHVIQEGMTEV